MATNRKDAHSGTAASEVPLSSAQQAIADLLVQVLDELRAIRAALAPASLPFDPVMFRRRMEGPDVPSEVR